MEQEGIAIALFGLLIGGLSVYGLRSQTSWKIHPQAEDALDRLAAGADLTDFLLHKMIARILGRGFEQFFPTLLCLAGIVTGLILIVGGLWLGLA